MKKFIASIIFIFGFILLTNNVFSQIPGGCTPDCEEDDWVGPTLLIVDYGDCTLNIWYKRRVACDTYLDLQILMITTSGSGCNTMLPLNLLFKRAYYLLLLENPMNWPPLCLPPNDSGQFCYDEYRISQAECWTVYEVVVVNDTNYVSIPCDSGDCCLQKMRICRDCPEGYLSLYPLQDPWSYNHCSESEPPIPPAPEGSECELVCNWYLYLENRIQGNNDTENSMIIQTSKEIVSKIIDGNLDLSIKAPKPGNYTIRITDVYGIMLKEQTGKINNNLNNIKIDLKDFSNGNYLYTIDVDGNLLKSGKFILDK
jgi:hypothetical protein